MNQMDRPNFIIVGLERAGGHWVTALLNAHPDIACFPTLYFVEGKTHIGELHFFNTIASIEEPNRPFVRPFDDFSWKYGGRYADLVPLKGNISDKELLEKFVKRYSEICEGERKGKKIVGELSSRYTTFLDWIDRFYPQIPKICILRDPKDRIVSWYQKKVLSEKGGKDEMVPREFAIEYAKNTVVKEYESLLAYPHSMYCISFETLYKNPIPAIEKMVEYLGLKHTPAIIAHMIEEASFEKKVKENEGTARRPDQMAMTPLGKSMVGDYKNVMTKEDAREVDAITGALEKRIIEKYHVIT